MFAETPAGGLPGDDQCFLHGVASIQTGEGWQARLEELLDRMLAMQPENTVLRLDRLRLAALQEDAFHSE